MNRRQQLSQPTELMASGGQKNRRPYQPPQLMAIDLKADEILAAGCKTAVGAAIAGSISGCYSGVICANDGS